MAGQQKGRRKIINEINITPLTDIFLVLLIIMMVVAPMMQAVDAEIKPPTVEGGVAVDQNRLTLEVTTDGMFKIGGETIPEAELTEALIKEVEARELKTEEERNLIIRADAKTRSGVVLKVFEAARDANFHKVTVAGEKPDKSRGAGTQAQPINSGPTLNDLFGEGS